MVSQYSLTAMDYREPVENDTNGDIHCK